MWYFPNIANSVINTKVPRFNVDLTSVVLSFSVNAWHSLTSGGDHSGNDDIVIIVTLLYYYYFNNCFLFSRWASLRYPTMTRGTRICTR